MARQSLSQPSENEKPVEGSSRDQSFSVERGDCLHSWKEIAAYLERDPRTVQRWEKTESLPVQRHVHASGGSVYAFTADLDAWLSARTRVAALTEVATPPETPVLTLASGEAQNFRRNHRLGLAVGATVLFVLTALLIRQKAGKDQVSRAAFESTPLTSLVGDEVSPSFSPDGKQIAYAWSGESGRHFKILVKSIGESTDKQVTPEDLSAFSPAWSPDGRQIAFLSAPSISDRPSIWLEQVNGSKPVKLTDTGGDGWPWYRAVAWMPDGKSLVSVGRDGPDTQNSLFIYCLGSHKREKVTDPPKGFSDYFPAVSPNGEQLLFTRFGKGTATLYRTGLKREKGREHVLYAERFRNSNLLASWWGEGGKDIFIAANIGGMGQLWRGQIHGPLAEAPELLASVPQNLLDVTGSSSGRELVYSTQLSDVNLWTLAFTGQAVEPKQDQGVLSSTRDEMAAQYSPDGSKLAFESNRSGVSQIWVAQRDGSGAIAVTHFKGAVTGSPSWSPNGSFLAFDTRVNGKAEVFVVPTSGGEPKQVTWGQEPNVVPSWSRDGQWIYFASPAGRAMQVWKIHPNGQGRTQVTTTGGFATEESKDGRYLFYTKSHDLLTAIWRKAAQGDEEVEIAEPVVDRCFAVGSKGVFYASTRDPLSAPALLFEAFGSKAPVVIRKLTKPIMYGLSLSPDERELTFAERDAQGSDLQIVRNIQ
ncbi:MAG: hypothetical protein M3Y24_02815 [Acidobacteriota bacterium]|nr:hypothetical protein [Acidobacteriota bacterium]